MATAPRPATAQRPLRSEYDVCEALKPRRKLPNVATTARQRAAEFLVGFSVGSALGLALGAIV